MSDTTTSTPAIHGDHAHSEHKAHANPWVVFAVLAALTVVEIVITLPQVGLAKATVTPILIAMALVKASLVAMYYMHLRYEKIIFTLIFLTPTLFAVLLVSVLMLG
jgi:cytochrome c oxidase subunit IV